MLRHLLTLTWKRKTRNLMLSLEIMLAFAIVFAISATGLRYFELSRAPLGFDGADVWSVSIRTGRNSEDSMPADIYDTLERGLRELPQVRDVAFAAYSPYTNATWTSTYKSPQTGAEVRANIMEASDGFDSALGVKLARGRWFRRSDEGAARQPVVVDEHLAAELFPGREALGQTMAHEENGATHTLEVVGVVEAFRHKGPLMTPVPFMMTRFAPLSSKARLDVILIKLAPGTPRAFEATLNRQLKLIRNDWTYRIAPLDSLRATMLKEQLTPLIVAAVVAAFMLVMVAFGLFGVLWQNVAQRITEIGLRRAVGARAGDIYRQIVAEQLLISTLAMLVGLALLVQLPLTGVLRGTLDWGVFAGATVLSMAAIYLLSLLCSLYPGWRASRLSPTDALHYE